MESSGRVLYAAILERENNYNYVEVSDWTRTDKPLLSLESVSENTINTHLHRHKRVSK